MVGDLCHTDCVDILSGDLLPVQSITEDFLQFPLDILHICPDFIQKVQDHRIRDLFLLPADDSLDPALQRPFILGRELYDMSFRLYRLVQFAALVHFIFYENEIRGLRHILDIVCQFCPRALEKTGILKHDQAALSKERQRLRQVDHFPYINVLPLIVGIVHRVAFREHRLYKTVSILPFQIPLLTVKEIDLFKLSCLKIFIQAFHNFSII